MDLNTNIKPILALIAVVGTFFLFYFQSVGKIDPSVKDIVLYILGVLSTIAVQVISFYFGSSEGSKGKDAVIEAQMPKAAVPPVLPCPPDKPKQPEVVPTVYIPVQNPIETNKNPNAHLPTITSNGNVA